MSAMSIRSHVTHQYQGVVDHAAVHASALQRPVEGWLRTARKALGMSGAQLARRLGVSRGLIAQTERNELAQSVSLKTLQQMADGMGCRLVYAIVPKAGLTQDIITARAAEKAQQLVSRVDQHMLLEGQGLSPDRLQYEVEQAQRQFVADMPADLWNTP
jgi:predicted DNA-binding mobile mystery protein A